MPLEDRFDTTLIAALANREKQIQQTYRPVIGVHKWFARRPGTLFRGLLLSEYSEKPLADVFFKGNHFPDKVIADPFMGGGTPLIEANRLGMKVIGSDINPMAYWTVRQALAPLDVAAFRAEAARVSARVEAEVGALYHTRCTKCAATATVKYFLWVKQYRCVSCGEPNDLFPGYLVATDDRHTSFVWYCPTCRQLAEVQRPPNGTREVHCPHCETALPVEPVAQRGKYRCRKCDQTNRYPDDRTVPEHRLFAIEYHCQSCREYHRGRYFKAPDEEDLRRVTEAQQKLRAQGATFIPPDAIPGGDETTRLHRWGYKRYRDLFNERQLLGLQVLLVEIKKVEISEVRLALATVFSDMLRYQNMLCRYDTMALKCQDIFSVHGFPVGLIQCENNLLGIPGVGSGGFRHFVEKYLRAKEYCHAPFEVMPQGSRKRQVITEGERIEAQFAETSRALGPSGAFIVAGDSSTLDIEPESLDGVFTDPPYFDNVQYAELMDFCYVWLRQLLADEVPAFTGLTTRNARELTGNATLGRGISEFTEGLSAVFRRMAVGLKRGAPLVFTYHHNDEEAYLPIIVAILDAGLACTATLACPAEMSASLHISGTGSSTVDTIFVCRKGHGSEPAQTLPFPQCLHADVAAIKRAGLRVTPGDVICMTLGHLSRKAIESLSPAWDASLPIDERLRRAHSVMQSLLDLHPPGELALACIDQQVRQAMIAEV